MVHLAMLTLQHHFLAAHPHHYLIARLLRRALVVLAAAMSCESCGATDSRRLYWGKWCSSCYNRWLSAGKPEAGPPRRSVTEAEHASRRAEIERLGRAGLTIQQIAWKLHVNPRTVTRWRRKIRIQQLTEHVTKPAEEQVPDSLSPDIPPAPPQNDPAEHAAAAFHIAGYAQDAGEALDFAAMLGVPGTAFAMAANGNGGRGAVRAGYPVTAQPG